MKALTIWQPWASLIIAGAKPYEFRGWRAPKSLVGQRIAIHAGARPVKPAEVRALLIRLAGSEPWSTALRPDVAKPLLDRVLLSPAVLPRSSVIGTAVLGEPIIGHQVVAEFGGTINDSDRDEHSNWAWPMLSIEPLEPYRPATGAQGFWEWSGE